VDSERLTSSGPFPEEKSFEASVRPRTFGEFVGQDRIKKNLVVYVEAAKKRKDVLDHILFSGPPGIGKTTLSYLVASRLGAKLMQTTGPALEKPGDLAGILTKLEDGSVLFIDEIHRLGSVVEEYLYSAMEDFSIDIVIDSGPHARSVHMKLPHFTLVGATTREGLLTAPFRARFGVLEKLEFYTWQELFKIIKRSSKILNISINDDAATIIAKRARGTPRLANRFLRRIRDLAQVEGDNRITEAIARKGLGMLGVDEHGLDIMDRKIISCLLSHGGAVGLKTISISVGESEDTIEEVYEPYLIQQGFLKKTPRGRVPSELAYKHFSSAKSENTLF
jgi:Holliday junction DNA helicase RuvB